MAIFTTMKIIWKVSDTVVISLYVIYNRNVYLASLNVLGSIPLLRIGSYFLYCYCQHTGGQSVNQSEITTKMIQDV